MITNTLVPAIAHPRLGAILAHISTGRFEFYAADYD